MFNVATFMPNEPFHLCCQFFCRFFAFLANPDVCTYFVEVVLRPTGLIVEKPTKLDDADANRADHWMARPLRLAHQSAILKRQSTCRRLENNYCELITAVAMGKPAQLT